MMVAAITDLLPKELLLIILIGAGKESTFSVKLTCKKWLAVTETIEYWRPLIAQALRKQVHGIDALRYDMSKMNLLCFYPEVPIRDVCEWMFLSDQSSPRQWTMSAYGLELRVEGKHDVYKLFFGLAPDGNFYASYYDLSASLVFGKHFAAASAFIDLTGETSFIHSLKVENGYSRHTFRVNYIAVWIDDETSDYWYIGQCRLSKGMFNVPHGSGTMCMSDGTMYQGTDLFHMSNVKTN